MLVVEKRLLAGRPDEIVSTIRAVQRAILKLLFHVAPFTVRSADFRMRHDLMPFAFLLFDVRQIESLRRLLLENSASKTKLIILAKASSNVGRPFGNAHCFGERYSLR